MSVKVGNMEFPISILIGEYKTLQMNIEGMEFDCYGDYEDYLRQYMEGDCPNMMNYIKFLGESEPLTDEQKEYAAEVRQEVYDIPKVEVTIQGKIFEIPFDN